LTKNLHFTMSLLSPVPGLFVPSSMSWHYCDRRNWQDSTNTSGTSL
jgi:hypothetical protein